MRQLRDLDPGTGTEQVDPHVAGEISGERARYLQHLVERFRAAFDRPDGAIFHRERQVIPMRVVVVPDMISESVLVDLDELGPAVYAVYFVIVGS